VLVQYHVCRPARSQVARKPASWCGLRLGIRSHRLRQFGVHLHMVQNISAGIVFVCVYIYIHIYICICVCVCVYCICMCVCIYIYIYVCMYTCVYVCICMYIHIYIKTHMHMYMCMHVYYTHTHTYIHTSIHTYMYMCVRSVATRSYWSTGGRICSHTGLVTPRDVCRSEFVGGDCVHAHAHVHTYKRLNAFTCMHLQPRSLSPSSGIDKHKSAHTNQPTNQLTNEHTHTHTHMQPWFICAVIFVIWTASGIIFYSQWHGFDFWTALYHQYAWVGFHVCVCLYIYIYMYMYMYIYIT
jgi:hypothetical protein